MTDIIPNPSDPIPDVPPDTAQVIGQLQTKLLALGRDLADDAPLPSAEIEKTAKAINQLIASVERADVYLRSQGQVQPGDGLSPPDRRSLLLKIRRMVENGILRELDDE